MRPKREADRILASVTHGVDFSKAGPTRTCVGCRTRVPAAQLVRFVVVEAGDHVRLQPDPGRRLPGRGAHLHPDPACFALAERRHAFGRALRNTGVLDSGLLAEHIRAVYQPAGTPEDGASSPRPTQLGRTTDMSTR